MATSVAVQARFIDPNDEPSLNRFLDGIAAGFANAALSRAFITEIDNTPPPYPSPAFNVPRIRRHVARGIIDSAHTGAELVEAGDFSALAVWETTSYRGVPFSERMTNVDRPIREEWRTKVNAMKHKYIGTNTNTAGVQELKPYYHLGFLVRNPLQENSVKGAISAVMRPWLERAEKEGVPVWLEATYSHAVDIYKHYGFRLVEILKIAVGKRDAVGWPEEGGEGVNGYCMIYDRHLRS